MYSVLQLFASGLLGQILKPAAPVKLLTAQMESLYLGPALFLIAAFSDLLDEDKMEAVIENIRIHVSNEHLAQTAF